MILLVALAWIACGFLACHMLGYEGEEYLTDSAVTLIIGGLITLIVVIFTNGGENL